MINFIFKAVLTLGTRLNSLVTRVRKVGQGIFNRKKIMKADILKKTDSRSCF